MVIRLKTRTCLPLSRLICRLKGIRKMASQQERWWCYNRDQARLLKPSGCIPWGLQHQLHGRVWAYDWLATISDKGLYLALGMKCWLAMMRQSGLSPWSRQKIFWHNLAFRLTEDAKSFRGQKVCSFYWQGQQSAQIIREAFFCCRYSPRINFINFIKKYSYIARFQSKRRGLYTTQHNSWCSFSALDRVFGQIMWFCYINRCIKVWIFSHNDSMN